MQTPQHLNPYAPPNSHLPTKTESNFNSKHSHLLTFVFSCVIPLLTAIAVFSNGWIRNPLSLTLGEITIGVFMLGWLYSIPFALLNNIQLWLLRKNGYQFRFKTNLFIFPLMFTCVWLFSIAVVFASYSSINSTTTSWTLVEDILRQFNAEFFVIFGFPAIATGIACSILWPNSSSVPKAHSRRDNIMRSQPLAQ